MSTIIADWKLVFIAEILTEEVSAVLFGEIIIDSANACKLRKRKVTETMVKSAFYFLGGSSKCGISEDVEFDITDKCLTSSNNSFSVSVVQEVFHLVIVEQGMIVALSKHLSSSSVSNLRNLPVIRPLGK